MRSAIGMLGKVWSSGALAVVQNVAIIPTSVHPRSKLNGEAFTAACDSGVTGQSLLISLCRKLVARVCQMSVSGCARSGNHLPCTDCSPLHPVPPADHMADRVAELAYIPVYDLRQPGAGVVACLEVMMSAFATSALVANVISHTCDLLTQFQVC